MMDVKSDGQVSVGFNQLNAKTVDDYAPITYHIVSLRDNKLVAGYNNY